MILAGFGCVMTEKEAWLKLAEMFDSNMPMPPIDENCYRIIGLCQGTAYLSLRRTITWGMEDQMDRHMFSHFQDDDNYGTFLWPENRRRTSRTPRATACGFLAAMCDD